MSRIPKWIHRLLVRGSAAAPLGDARAIEDDTAIALLVRCAPSIDALTRQNDAPAARAVALVHVYAGDPQQLIAALLDLVGQGKSVTERLTIDLILAAEPSVQAVTGLLLGSHLERSRAAGRVLERIKRGSAPAIPTLVRSFDTHLSERRRSTIILALTRIGERAIFDFAEAFPSQPIHPQILDVFRRPPRNMGRDGGVFSRPERSMDYVGETGTAILEEASKQSKSTGVAVPEPTAEVPRYTDVALFQGHIFNADLTSSSPAVAEDTALRPGAEYTLTVAIRATRQGIGADEEPAHAVRNPRVGREDIDVYVVVTPLASLTKALTVAERFKKLNWQFGADSDVAVFHLDALAAATGDLEIRMYDKSLDLLDIVRVAVAVAPEADTSAPPRRVYWPDRPSALLPPQQQLTQRLAAVHVRKAINGYEFEFLLHDQDGEPVRIPILCEITTDDLEALLRKVRNFWTKLVVTNYSDQLSVTHATFARYLDALRELGIEAWTTLFGARFADLKGSSETMADFLMQTHVPDGAIIQISQDDSGTGFVFPWALLYPVADEQEVDPYNFWGAKYRIEQVTRGPEATGLDEQPINMLFALDRSFDSSAAHAQQIAAFAAAAKTRVAVTGPICTEPELFAGLKQNPAAHFIYFFCHGFTASTNPVLRADGVQMLKQSIEAIEAGTPEREALETLLHLTAQMDDYSWMYIGGSQIKETELKIQKFFEKRRPIVFLNMCQSADLLPSLSTGFVRLFLDHNASAVIGTESPMTATFASAFAEKVLEMLFQGDDVGLALWKARRHFLQPEIRNPLGLAYTLYGRAVARLGASNPSPQVNPDPVLTP